MPSFPERARSIGRAIFEFDVPPQMRALVRSREWSLVLLGAPTGAVAGLVVAAMRTAVAVPTLGGLELELRRRELNGE